MNWIDLKERKPKKGYTNRKFLLTEVPMDPPKQKKNEK